MSSQVAVLFAKCNSIYKKIPACDVYDVKRDARTFRRGDMPIIAHPPCRLFSRLRHMSTAPVEEKQLAYWAIEQVRACGGVLEHPAHSKLWEEKGLPLPGAPVDEFGGWTLEVPQFWFGHRAQKETWLYIVGCARKDIPAPMFKLGSAQYACGCPGREKKKYNNKPSVRKSEIAATPPAFAEWLIDLALRTKKGGEA